MGQRQRTGFLQWRLLISRFNHRLYPSHHLTISPSPGLGHGDGGAAGHLVPDLPGPGAHRPRAASAWVRCLTATWRARDVSHFVADNQVIPSSLTLNIMFLFSATCPTCRQRLDQAEEEGQEEGEAAEEGEEGAAEEEEGGEEE